MKTLRRITMGLPLVTLLLLVRDARGIGGGTGGCKDGDTFSCHTPDGKAGTRACVNGVLSTCYVPPPASPPPRPDLPGKFDLVGTPGSPEFDDNHIRLNPQFRVQSVYPKDLPWAYDNVSNGCGAGPTATTMPWESPCTSQHSDDDTWSVAADVGSFLGNLTHIYPNGGCGTGHHNWMPVTYAGAIYWESHSPSLNDDDYNIRIVPPAVGTNAQGVALGAGITGRQLLVYPPTSEVIDPFGSIKVYPSTKDMYPSNLGVPTAGIEFSSDETIDHFTTTWWSRFHSAVDDFGNDAGVSSDCYFKGDPKACSATSALFHMISGKFAIVTGLFGMDTAHEPYAEIHPAFAMAIRVNDDPADETWEIFVRRSGNEGFCASNMHFLDLPDNTYTFRFPSRGTSVEVTLEEWGTELGSIARQFPTGIDPSQGKLLSFVIPPPQYVQGRLVSDMIHGEVHLKWSGGLVVRPPRPLPVGIADPGLIAPGVVNRGGVGAPPGGAVNVPPAATAPSPEPEEGLEGIVGTMTPSQKQLFVSKMPTKGVPIKHAKPPKMMQAAAARATKPGGGVIPPIRLSPTTHAVPDPVKRAFDQRIADALHAVYGPNLDQNLPPKPPPPPPRRCIRNPKTGEVICQPTK